MGHTKKPTFQLKTVMFSVHQPFNFEQMLQVRLREGVIQDYNTEFRYAAVSKNGQWVFATLRRVDWSRYLHSETVKRLSDRDRLSGILVSLLMELLPQGWWPRLLMLCNL